MYVSGNHLKPESLSPLKKPSKIIDTSMNTKASSSSIKGAGAPLQSGSPTEMQQQQIVNTPKGNPSCLNPPNNISNDQGNFSSNEGEDKTSKFKEDFSVGKIIGKGAYALVRVGLQKKWNRRVAIKIYDRKMLENPGRQRAVKSEINILTKLQHPNIIQLFEVIESNNHLNLILEYVPGPSLQFYLKSKQRKMLRESEARVMFRKIVEAVDYCHKMNVNHRDLKLENILIDPVNGPKLIDFGFATCLPQNFKARIYCGTPTYMSPEIVKKEEYDGAKADMWALGVLLFTLLTGTFPFSGEFCSYYILWKIFFFFTGKSEQEVFSKICRGSFVFPIELTAEVRSLIKNLLNMEMDKRPTAEEVILINNLIFLLLKKIK
jgi:serine/threonine protein kinase